MRFLLLLSLIFSTLFLVAEPVTMDEIVDKISYFEYVANDVKVDQTVQYVVDTGNIAQVIESDEIIGYIVPLLPEGFFFANAAKELPVIEMLRLRGTYEQYKNSGVMNYIRIKATLGQMKLGNIPEMKPMVYKDVVLNNLVPYVSFNQDIALQYINVWNNINNNVQLFSTSSTPHKEDPLIKTDGWVQTGWIADRIDYDYIGCVALTSVNIMNYWKYPSVWQPWTASANRTAKIYDYESKRYVAPYGSSIYSNAAIYDDTYYQKEGEHFYYTHDANIKNDPYIWNSSSSDYKDSIARLAHDVGASINMKWSDSGSYASLYISGQNLEKNFGFNKPVYWKMGKHGVDASFKKIVEQIDFGFPIASGFTTYFNLSLWVGLDLKILGEYRLAEWDLTDIEIAHAAAIDGYFSDETHKQRLVHMVLGWDSDTILGLDVQDGLEDWVQIGSPITLNGIGEGMLDLSKLGASQIIEMLTLGTLHIDYDIINDLSEQYFIYNVFPANFGGWRDKANRDWIREDKPDGVDWFEDNCPAIYNPGQEDSNSNGIGDHCEDRDGDGVLDIDDNCKDDPNPDQLDSDGDGVGDVCDNCPSTYNPNQADTDRDKIGDACDNCINDFNPMEIAPDTEIFWGTCDQVSDSNCVPGAKNNPAILSWYKKGDAYYWQPDHDLDGIGDACDTDSNSAVFRSIPLGKTDGTKVGDDGEKVTIKQVQNRVLDVPVQSDLTSDSTLTTRYCRVGSEDIALGRWGKEGRCSTEAGLSNNQCEKDYGYSHGTDPKPADEFNNPYWNKVTLNGQEEFLAVKQGKTKDMYAWSWREDMVRDDPELASTLTGEVPELSDTVQSFYYTLSTGVRSDVLTSYIKTDGTINPAYFKNSSWFARTSRVQKDPLTVSYYYNYFYIYYDYTKYMPYCDGAPCGFPMELEEMLMMAKLKQIIDSIMIGPRPMELPWIERYFKNDFGADFVNRWADLREWNVTEETTGVKNSSVPFFLVTAAKTATGSTVGLELQMTAPSMQMFKTAFSSSYSFNILEKQPDSNGDWSVTGKLQNMPADFVPFASISFNNELYVLSHTSVSGQKALYKLVSDEASLVLACGGNWRNVIPVKLAEFDNISSPSLIELDGQLMIIGDSPSGMSIQKLVEDNQTYSLVDISGTNRPSSRNLYNIAVKDGILYLAGGASILQGDQEKINAKTDVWSFSQAGKWTQLRNDLNIMPINLKVDVLGDKLYLTSRIDSSDGTTKRIYFNKDGSGAITGPEIVQVDGISTAYSQEEYCYVDNGSSVEIGTGTLSCTPLSDPHSTTVTLGNTYEVFSLAGRSNTLFVGSNNKIYSVDISDPDNPEMLDSLYVSGWVDDLVVKDRYVIAAKLSGFDIIDVSDPLDMVTVEQVNYRDSAFGWVTGLELINNNSQLLAADSDGVTLFSLVYENGALTAQSQGLIIPSAFEIEEMTVDGDMLYLFDAANNLTVYDMSGTAPQLVADSFLYCTNPELGSKNNMTWIACDEYMKKVEITGSDITFSPVSGNPLDMREGYLYNDNLYLPADSYISVGVR